VDTQAIYAGPRRTVRSDFQWITFTDSNVDDVLPTLLHAFVTVALLPRIGSRFDYTLARYVVTVVGCCTRTRLLEHLVVCTVWLHVLFD